VRKDRSKIYIIDKQPSNIPPNIYSNKPIDILSEEIRTMVEKREPFRLKEGMY